MGRSKGKTQSHQRKTRKQTVKALKGLSTEQLQLKRQGKGALRDRLVQARTTRRYLISLLLVWFWGTFDTAPSRWSEVPAAVEAFIDYLHQECVGVNIANDTLAGFNYYFDEHAFSFRKAKKMIMLWKGEEPPMRSASMPA